MIWLVVPVAVYSVGIFTLWLILRGMRNNIPSAAGPLPRVTVVVAARNEENTIETLLESLSYQDYPPDLLEITIVND
ncbi:MAG: glycosyltransferase family 2 protein, partial [Bacteroidales bacterium]